MDCGITDISIFSILSRIDLSSILFFLGILLAVNALKTVGHLALLANSLDGISISEPGKYYVINVIIGVLSSVIDNVPLVAGSMDRPTSESLTLMVVDDFANDESTCGFTEVK